MIVADAAGLGAGAGAEEVTARTGARGGLGGDAFDGDGGSGGGSTVAIDATVEGCGDAVCTRQSDTMANSTTPVPTAPAAIARARDLRLLRGRVCTVVLPGGGRDDTGSSTTGGASRTSDGALGAGAGRRSGATTEARSTIAGSSGAVGFLGGKARGSTYWAASDSGATLRTVGSIARAIDEKSSRISD